MVPGWVDVGQPDRVLPPGEHDATVEEVRAALVDAFPTSPSRPDLFSRWAAWRDKIHKYLDVKQEFIDGSFVTDRDDAHDIDTSIWFDPDAYDGLPVLHQQAVMSDFRWAKRAFLTHAFLVPVCPQGHPLRQRFEHMRTDTARWWRAYKDPAGNIVPGVEKGYLRIVG